MKEISGTKLIKALKKRGWKLDRIKGSHHIMVHASSRATLSIPVHGNRPLKPGLLNYFLKTAGMDEGDA